KADAQDAFSCIEELSDDEVRYRVRYIEKKLEDGKKHATRWRYTWMSLWLAGGAGMTYAAVEASRKSDDANKFGWAYLAAGSYFVGLTHAFIPAPDVWGAKRIRRQESDTEQARRAQLLYATQTLKKAANVQGLNSGALGVVGGLIYGVVGGPIKATQWPGKSRGLTAAIYVAPVVLLGLQTATAPTEGLKGYEAYRGIACSSKYYDTHEEGPEFDFSANPGGTSFTIKF
ncbi:MAG: hypothetical protein JSV06_03750, partial [Myxococcales bacterium]